MVGGEQELTPQFPKVEKIILPESLRRRLDSEPLVKLARSKGVNKRHSYLETVLKRTHPRSGVSSPEVGISEWREVRRVASTELKFLYEKLLGVGELQTLYRDNPDQAYSLLGERIPVMVKGLSEPADTHVLLDIRLVDSLARYKSSLGEGLEPYKGGAGLFRLYLDGVDKNFKTKKEKIISIKENFRLNTPSPSEDIAKAVGCSQGYAKKIKSGQSGNRERLSKSKRREILDRDNRECQVKFSHEEKCSQSLEIHHKDGNGKNNNPDNLITLCEDHHRILENEIQVMCAQLKAEKREESDTLRGHSESANEAKVRASAFLDGKMEKRKWGDEICQLTDAFVQGGRDGVSHYFQKLFGKQPVGRHPEHWY